MNLSEQLEDVIFFVGMKYSYPLPRKPVWNQENGAKEAKHLETWF